MIIWDENKNVKLKIERNISFEEISDYILSENIVLKTIFPSRKLHKKYRGEKWKKKN